MQSRLGVKVLPWESQVIHHRRGRHAGPPEGVIMGLPDHRLVTVRQRLRGTEVVGVIVIDPGGGDERQGHPLEIDVFALDVAFLIILTE